MAFEFGELLQGSILHTRFSDVITDAQLMEYAEAELKHGYLTKHRGELVDGREVTGHKASRAGLNMLSAKVRKHEHLLRGRRVAMLADDDVTYGMFRMWELQREDIDYEVAVFRDYDEAMDWLRSCVPTPPVRA